MYKAKVAFIGDVNPMSDYKHETYAIKHVLEKDHDLECLLYHCFEDFKQDLDEKQFSLDEVIMMLIGIYEFKDYGNSIIDLSTKVYDNGIPVIIFPCYHFDEDNDDDYSSSDYSKYDNIHFVEYDGDFLFDLIPDVKKKFKKRQQILFVSDEIELLEYAYNYHYSGDKEDERVLGVPCFNDKIVAEYLRCRQLGGNLVKAEYDDILPRKPLFLKIVDEIYMVNLNKIKQLSKDEKRELHAALLRCAGRELLKGGGIRVKKPSQGQNIRGFAIHPETLVYLETTQAGQHCLADHHLKHRLCRISQKRDDYDAEPCDFDVITGLIHEKVPDYDVPILELSGLSCYSDETIRKIGKFIINQGKYIPIDQKQNVLDEDYEFPYLDYESESSE